MGVAAGRAKDPSGLAARYPSLPYIAPFIVFLIFLALDGITPADDEWMYPLRVLVVSAVLLIFSRGAIDFRLSNGLGSAAVGLAVFAIWIGPDALWPGYRSQWLFTNSLTGGARSSTPDALRSSLVFLTFRSAGCVLLVPVIEELFWRAWLPRWIIDSHDFRNAPLGAYTAFSFWVGALLFASEHGPFWEVGLVAGIVYNCWMIRTRNLADCILAHAVTNGALLVYVLATGQWQYLL